MNNLDNASRTLLLQLARQSIVAGLGGVKLDQEASQNLPPALGENAACFVTLKKDDELRGCIGSLQASRPLAQEVALRAQDAAFHDPRFAPLRNDELSQILISISVLTHPEPFPVDNEQCLLASLKPDFDGLILHFGKQRATFLPSVWKQLPERQEFLSQLKLKAGLAADFWSDDLFFERYTTLEFSEE